VTGFERPSRSCLARSWNDRHGRSAARQAVRSQWERPGSGPRWNPAAYHEGVMEVRSHSCSNDGAVAIPLISIVDDDHSVRDSLARLIRSVGFGVQVFGSAEEFLSAGHGRDADCLILDIRMPGMNGLELQQQLTASDSDLPVIFITAHGSDDDVRTRALRAGAVDYLLKPLREAEVLKAIDAALSSR
jgi:CheY-like chemotaxis protein